MYSVFIVDDEPSVLDGLKIMINWEKIGMCICDEIDNGDDAINRIIKNPPDIVITDICMPGIDGVSMIEKLRKEGVLSEFILLSGFGNFDYAKKAMKNQVKYFLVKPLDVNEIEQVLLELKKSLDKKHLENGYYTEKTVESDYSYETKLPETIKRRILDSVELMDVSEIEKSKKNILNYFLDNNAGIGSIKVNLNEIIFSIFKMAEDRNIEVNQFLEHKFFTLSSKNCIETTEIFKSFDSILNLLANTLKEERKKDSKRYLYNVKEYLDHHFTEDITVNELAEKFFVDSVYLSNSFSKQFNCGIKTYIHNLRINKVKELIKTTDLPIAEIAESVGYNNYNNFLYHFQKREGIMPYEYRKL